MDEYERLEGELAEEYEVYLVKFRNLDFLEHEVDVHNRKEKEKMEAASRALKRLQKKLREEEFRMFIGDQVGARARVCV
jgi:clusterin-associated protein 1